jgi:hypothetical protein
VDVPRDGRAGERRGVLAQEGPQPGDDGPSPVKVGTRLLITRRA